MKIIFLSFVLIMTCFSKLKAGNGDSIFNMQYIHTLHITFPYPNFYDSLLNSHTTDQYLQVDIDFNGQILNNVGIKAKGNSSFNSPSQKKSFKLDLNEFISGQDLHGLKKINFNNSFKDPSFMREKLANHFLIDHGIPAPRVTYCNVYMNNQLWGLYAVIEEIDDEFCKKWFSNNDGNLFKGDPHGDLRWKGSATQSLYETEYELKNNSTTNNWSDLISLISIIYNTPVSNLQAALEPKLNTVSFVKQWAALNMFSSLDSYIGSGHNYYIYHDTILDKFQWIAWDNNEAFGSFKNSLSSAQLLNLDLYYLSNPTSKPLCNNMLNNPYFKELYKAAYCELKQDFNNIYFDPKIDSLKNKIQSSVYADPKKIYTSSQFDSSFNFNLSLSGPGGLTIFGLKSFITDRSNNIQSNLTSNGVICWPNSISSIDKENKTIQLSPNPVIDILDIVSETTINNIQVFDMLGKIILNREGLQSYSEQLDFKEFPTGIYIVQVNKIHKYRILK